MRSAGRVDLDQLDEFDHFLSLIETTKLHYTDFSASISHRAPLLHATTEQNDLYSRIIQPYNVNAFEIMLDKFKLTDSYPNLCNNLRHGFPLGNMPPLTKTIIIPNHPSTLIYPEAVHEYLAGEVGAGRMSGPFSLEDVETALRGPVFVSPLIVAVQPQLPGEPDKLRVCRHLSKDAGDAPSVNSHIDKTEFPTRFDTASRVADIVSLCSFHPHCC